MEVDATTTFDRVRRLASRRPDPEMARSKVEDAPTKSTESGGVFDRIGQSASELRKRVVVKVRESRKAKKV
jgi:hypothetical protein